jgi:hypothetical protein
MKHLEKLNEKIEQFKTAVCRGIESFEEAGRLLVEILDDDPKAREQITEGGKAGITEDTLAVFESIGRRQLFYRLCLNNAPGVRALTKCPYSEQVRFADEPIEMLLLDGKESLQVGVGAMSAQQVKQVFGNRRIRTLGEQRAWLEGHKAKPQNIAIEKPYTVRRGRIVFHKPCELTIQQLGLLLAEAAS